MDALPLWLTIGIFVVASAAVWIAGISLSNQTDVLATRLHLGSALGGVVLLAVATNLPELAITASAALSGDVGVAVGNILGGIALQTVVLVVLDVFGRRRDRRDDPTERRQRPLTYRAASLVLVVEGLLVIAVLVVVVAGTQLPKGLIAFRLAPAAVLILLLWVVGLVLISRAHRVLPWHESGQPPDGQPEPQGHSRQKTEQTATAKKVSTTRSALVFGIAAVVTLAGGVALERSGDAIASDIGLSGVLFGATVLAAATSLPELSTGLQSIKQGDDQLAVSDIFGGNAFLPVLFLLATVLSGQAVLPQAQTTDIYLTAVGMLLTAVYVVGLLFRPSRRVLGMGVDSLVVLVLYAVGIAGLFTIAAAG